MIMKKAYGFAIHEIFGLPRDLFESQPSGERKIVVSHPEKQAEKVVWFLIGTNRPSARRMDDE